MKVLVVTPYFPWPEITGARLRVANVVRALARLGPVDLFAIDGKGRAVPPDEPIARVGRASRPTESPRGIHRIRRIATGRLSLEVRDYSELRSAFTAWARAPYDLAWLERVETFVALGDLVQAPSIVDFDDLQNYKLSGWLATNGSLRIRGERPSGVLRRWGSRVQGAIDLRLWRTLQRKIASSVEAVAVCSALDRERVDVSNAVVIPNGYSAPRRPAGHIEVRDPPTVTFVGLLSYPPNRDAAFYLVREILPHLRARVPRVQVRLVGRYSPEIEELADSRAVTVTGVVQDIGLELSRADVVVAPIRFGGGTRVKILEAFAHRIPVVSTSVGCEGLEAIDGRHLLSADKPDDFARACSELLTNRMLRTRLTDAAHDLFWRRYRSDLIAQHIADVAARIARNSWSTTGATDTIKG